MARKNTWKYDMRNLGMRHPKADPKCMGCAGRGWAVFTRCGWGEEKYKKYDGCLAVQKCDECGAYDSDAAAAKAAKKAGVKCRMTYPCIVVNVRGEPEKSQ